MREFIVAIVAGIVQGIVEWLPVSSQGNLALVLTLMDVDPDTALQLALFFQLGTTVSAASYYRDDLETAFHSLSGWRPDAAYRGDNAITSYLGIACLMTGIVGIPLYLFAVDLAGQLTGGAFITIIGVLLLLTGGIQYTSESVSMGVRETPTLRDSLLVGAVQGVAILPGISRSGVTTSALLFRRYNPSDAFRLSFLLSIPASLGGAALTVAGAGGLPGISPAAAATALLVSAGVGYVMIDALVRVVDRISFSTVCFGLGGLAIVGGGAVSILV
ncbi:undecaprenyl-diphosphate phosphatase [Natrialba asiatica]|uniref:Undecaprenyl-diphosphatase n=1 Tax=Natrialba asiatica (strain ATCC 700177 / DSM 12278 / JCM 9576 / FERM P-10747 / NBRC 102637 / 172P1) TaxID=29540 RepID=M0B8W8_NATA1|nr:undecaprenyl-diphosphate phosphatase [Natrialba asiatica]ELZ06074.1 Undecaprenyl-diphosphatase [Natrialba asiatica DSM 12278]